MKRILLSYNDPLGYNKNHTPAIFFIIAKVFKGNRKNMIFILEDNEDRIHYFKQALGDSEYHIERTVPEAIQWLQDHKAEVTRYSLDNDLTVFGYEGDEGEGWQLCEWLIANTPPKPILCHSTNYPASVKMEMMCQEAGWSFTRLIPVDGFEWIDRYWKREINADLQ